MPEKTNLVERLASPLEQGALEKRKRPGKRDRLYERDVRGFLPRALDPRNARPASRPAPVYAQPSGAVSSRVTMFERARVFSAPPQWAFTPEVRTRRRDDLFKRPEQLPQKPITRKVPERLNPRPSLEIMKNIITSARRMLESTSTQKYHQIIERIGKLFDALEKILIRLSGAILAKIEQNKLFADIFNLKDNEVEELTGLP